MDRHANQLWSPTTCTCPRDNVTSYFMAPPTSIHSADMKVGAPGISIIHQVMSPLWFSWPPFASLPLLATSLTLLSTCVTSLAWNSPLLARLYCHPSVIPRECGKPKRVWLYYTFVSRRNCHDPSLPLPPTSSPGRGQNWIETPPPPCSPRFFLRPLLKFFMAWEFARWKKKCLLLRISPWITHSSLATSPSPRPDLWSMELAWWRKKSPQLVGRLDCQEI